MIPPHDPVQAHRLHLLGIAMMCGTSLCFAGVDTIAKYLGREMHIVEVVWARYVAGFVLVFAIFNPVTRPGITRTQRPWLQLGRSALLLMQTVCNFLALRWLQLDQAMAIIFSTPLLVAALAGPMLGEKIGARRWAAILVGLVGVLVVLRPGFGAVHPAAALLGVFAICAALFAIATRILARTDPSDTTLFYSNLIGALAVTPFVPFVWTAPGAFQLLLMAAFGALASIGHALMIAAHRHAPASVLSPFIYTQLLWVVILGWTVFGDVPTGWTLIGGGIVIASGLYLLHRERLDRPRLPRA